MRTNYVSVGLNEYWRRYTAVMNMPGIAFLHDRKGRRKAVLIDLKKHKQLWEDLYDAYLAHSRRCERRESLAMVKRLIEGRAKHRARG